MILKSKIIKNACLLTSVVNEDHPIDRLLNHYSDWYRLKRAVAWLKLVDVLRGSSKSSQGKLTAQEIKYAEI